MDELISKIYLSRSFRRLAGKTQLYSDYNNDHFHNRLTHTLEVKNIAEKIRSKIGYGKNGKSVEAIALAHDLGHTPFGHAGERALNEITYQVDNLSGTIVNDYTSKVLFKHNYHSAKALLSICGYDNGYSNVLAGSILHTDLDYKLYRLTKKDKKSTIRFYLKNYKGKKKVEKKVLNKRVPVESQIVALADEIAQRVSDFHDLLMSKDYIIDYNEMKKYLPNSILLLANGYPNTFKIKELMLLLLKYYVDGVVFQNGVVSMAANQMKSMEDLAEKRKEIIKTSKIVSDFDKDAEKIVKTIFAKLYKNPFYIDNKMVDSIFARIKEDFKEQSEKGKSEIEDFNPSNYEDSTKQKCDFFKKIYATIHSKSMASFSGPKINYLKEINSELVYGIVFYIANMTDRFAKEKYNDLKNPIKKMKIVLTKRFCNNNI